MKINRLLFSIDIKAEKKQIWNALWKEDCYRAWAGVFYAGSYVLAENWEEGSTVLFLGADQNGIYSRIETHVPNSVIKFRHIGSVLKGEKQAIDEEAKKWSGATEMYSLIPGPNFNTLSVEIDVMEEHLDFMSQTFPKALEKVKSLSKDQERIPGLDLP